MKNRTIHLERDALLTARKVADLYSQAIETSRNMHANGGSAKDIDKKGKIDDGPAFKALAVPEGPC